MTDYNATLYEKLYSKLAIAVGAGSKENPGTIGESLLSIYNPGQYLPVNLDPVNNADDDQEISQLFDTAPMFNFTYTPGALRVSDAYKSILDLKTYPIADLSEKEKAKLAAAEKDYEERQEKCDAAETAYWAVVSEYDAAQANYENKTGPAPSAALKAKVKSAMDKWVAAGKIKQQTNLAIMKQLQGRDGSAFWDKLDQRFAENERELPSGLRFPPATLAPRYASWFKDEGWTKFEFVEKDLNNQSTSTNIGVAGNLDGKFGIVTISGSGSYQEDKEYIKVEETSLSFKCELMRVTISRNWMNPLVFNSRAWKFEPMAPAAELSSGGSLKDKIVPTGAFVAIPTTVILARNVEILGKFQNTVEERMKREIEAEASLGIGPFSIAGSVQYKDRRESIKGTFAENKISINNTQIIAAISQVLPQVPNPDPNLPWAPA